MKATAEFDARARFRRRFAGEAITRPWRADAGIAATCPLAAGAAAIASEALGAGEAIGAERFSSATVPTTLSGARAVRAFVLGANSNTIKGDPTATLSPGSPLIDSTVPLTAPALRPRPCRS